MSAPDDDVPAAAPASNEPEKQDIAREPEQPAAAPAPAPSGDGGLAFERLRGRPPKITPELIVSVCAAMRAGAYIETACASNGISRTARLKWLARGSHDIDKGRSTIHADFVRSVRRATAEGELRCVLGLDRAASPRTEVTTTIVAQDNAGVKSTTTTRTERPIPGDWRADAWRLERKFPDRYGLTQRIRIEADRHVDELLDRLRDALPDETFRQVLGALAREAAAGDEAPDGDAAAGAPDGDGDDGGD